MFFSQTISRQSFGEKFYHNFVEDNRWHYLLDGLANTLLITVFSLIIGLCLGFLVAYVRVTHHNTGRLKVPSAICGGYLSVIRGTPVVVQLMIIYFVLFSYFPINKVVAAIIGFGINSGAYVAEIFRSGIMSIDAGQMEAGRSLGLGYRQSMWRIIMPQAVKNCLPSLANEMITLLKETSVAGYIAVQDLTKAADIIRSRTYEAFFPLIAVAVIYFVLVKGMEFGVSRLERRLRQSDRR